MSEAVLTCGACGAAVQAALAAVDRFLVLRRQPLDRGFPDLQLRGAVTTGYVTSGCVGDARHATFTIVGRPVHLASRLQVLAPPGTVLVDQPTAQRIEAHFALERMDTAILKGIDRKVEVWRVLGPRGRGPAAASATGGSGSWSGGLTGSREAKSRVL